MTDKQEGSTPPHNEHGLRALYSGVLHNLQMAQYREFAAEARLLGLLAANLVVFVLAAEKVAHNHLVLGGVAVLLVSIVFAIIGLWPRVYYTAAVRVRDNLGDLERADHDLLAQLIIDADHACDKMVYELERKNRFYIWTVITFAVGAALSFLAFDGII